MATKNRETEVLDLGTTHRALKDLEATVKSQAVTIEALTKALEALTHGLDALNTTCAEHRREVTATLRGDGSERPEECESDEQRASREGLITRVAEVESLVRGRNRSAPVKRNMTDADAVRVLTGDAKDLDHKEAGELVGLTYAQVYSCRLEYTFKHVHKDLKNSGWKNHWVKK